MSCSLRIKVSSRSRQNANASVVAFSGVVYAPHQAVSLGGLANDLELIVTCCDLEELQDRVVYLPLR